MLVLTRKLRQSISIVKDGQVVATVYISKLQGKSVKLAIESNCEVFRTELLDQKGNSDG